MIPIFDRYLGKIFLGYFFAALIVFSSLYLAVDYMTWMASFQAPFSAVMAYYGYLLPSILYQILPIACILASIFALSGLNRTNELVALFSSGVSLARVSMPILIITGFLCFVSFLVSDLVMPSFEQKKEYIYHVDIRKQPGLVSTIKSDKIWYRSENKIFNLQTFKASESKAQGLTLYFFDEFWNLLQVITAKEVSLEKENWVLKDGSVSVFSEEHSFPVKRAFSEKTIKVSEELSELDLTSSTSVDMMGVQQLNRFIQRNKAAGLDTLEYEVGLQRKFSFAFAGLVLAFVGIPFSVANKRSGSGLGRNAAICIGLVFGYWILYSSFLNFGKHGVIPPFVAAWTPNFLASGIALYLLLRLKK